MEATSLLREKFMTRQAYGYLTSSIIRSKYGMSSIILFSFPWTLPTPKHTLYHSYLQARLYAAMLCELLHLA